MWNPPLIDEAAGDPALGALARRPSCSPTWSRTACGRSASCAAAAGIELIQRFARERLERARQAASWPSGSRPTAPATRRSSGARSRPRSPPASCSPSSPPMRSSSGSTSASSTPRSASPSRAPSRACARCGAGPGAGAAASRSTSPARTRSTSSSAATPRSSSSARSRPRSSTTPPSRSGPAPGRRRLRAAAHGARTPRCSARAGASGPSAWSPSGELRRAGGGCYPAEPGFAAGADLTALGLGGLGRGRSTRESGEMLGLVEAERAFTTDPPRRRLPAPRPLLRGRASSTSTPAARSSAPSTATGTHGRRRRPRSSSSELEETREVAGRRAALRRASR